MTQISASSSSTSYTSPLERLKSELATQVASGKVAATDETALGSALDGIDSTLGGGAASSGSARPDPAKIQSKIADLISQQVSSGKLTSAQGEELAGVFSAAAPNGSRGPGGPGGAGGPPPGPPPSDDDTDGSATRSSSTTDVSTLLSTFLKTLQDQQGSSGYGASGQTKTAAASSLVVDFAA